MTELKMVYIGTMNFHKLVWISLNQLHELQKTGPRWSGLVHSTSGLVLDQLWSMTAHFRGKKPDQTGPANTNRNHKNENKEDKPEKSSCCLSGGLYSPPMSFSRIHWIPTGMLEFHGIPMESIWLEPQSFWSPIP